MFELEIEPFLVWRVGRLRAGFARVGHVLGGQLLGQRDGRVQSVLVLRRDGPDCGHGQVFRFRSFGLEEFCRGWLLWWFLNFVVAVVVIWELLLAGLLRGKSCDQTLVLLVTNETIQVLELVARGHLLVFVLLLE